MLLLAVMLPALASAHDFEVDGIYYNVNGNKATVTYRGASYSSYSNEYSGAVVIPSSVTYGGQTYTVTSIGYYAFYGCSELRCVLIPNYITSIGDRAFYGCSNLKIVIWNAVNCTSIGSNAFNYSLNTLQFGNGVEHIPAGLPSFSGYSLVLPNSVKTIDKGAFTGNCSTVILGDKIENIATGVFPGSIRTVYVTSSEPLPCEEGAFTNPQTLYVPVGSRMSYFVSPGWSEFSNIVEENYVRASYIVLNQSSVALTKGTTQQINATILPNNASCTYATWLSLNPDIATVDSNGKITAVAVGEADIVAMVDNVRAICHVTVTPMLAESITLSDTLLTLQPGDMRTITATVLPNNADNQTLEWIIPDNDVIVAQVVNNTRLNIAAVGLGSVPITVRTTDGSNQSASCIVNVLQNYLTGEITFTQGGEITEVYYDGDIVTYYEYVDICYTGQEDVLLSILVDGRDILSNVTDEYEYDISNAAIWNEEINGYRVYMSSLLPHGYFDPFNNPTYLNFEVTVHANGYNELCNSDHIGYVMPVPKPKIAGISVLDYCIQVHVDLDSEAFTRKGIIVNGDAENLWDDDYKFVSNFYVAERLNEDYEITVRAEGYSVGVYYVGDEMTITVPAINNGISISLSDLYDDEEQNTNPTTKKYLKLDYFSDGDYESSVYSWNVIINGNPIEVNQGDENFYDIVNYCLIDLLPYGDSYGGDYFVQATAFVYDLFTGYHEVYAEEHIEYYFPIPVPTISSNQTNDAVIIDVVTELSEKKLKVDGVEVDALPYSVPRLDHDYYITIQAGCSPDGERWTWTEEESILIPARVSSNLHGDVDCNDAVNISDVTALIDYLLSGDASSISLSNADCDVSGEVNISDVTTLIDYLLSGNWPEPAQVITSYTVNGVSFNMVEVEGGSFMMGGTPEQGDDVRNREKPVHQVTLSSYNIGQTEVTQELWRAVMGANPSYHVGDLQRPVEQVSWTDCIEFISTLNQLTGKSFRLPTEAEWEYAARGGKQSQGYRYAGGNDMDAVSWFLDNSENTTHHVATKAPNELGLYDMTGNVWEWTSDWFALYSEDAQVNPAGPGTGNNRVLRGGCWNGDANYNRIAFRDNFTPTGSNSSGGMRLVLDVDNSSKFRLSETVLKVEVNGSKAVNIFNGGGSYTVGGGTDVVSTAINGNQLTVTGIATGTTTVHLTDAETGATAVLAVIVTERHDEEFNVNGVTFKMVTVDGGTFTMGATAEQGSDFNANERPVHDVSLSNYKIGQTEVTQELWQAVMGSNPSNFIGDLQRPVDKVSWNDCQSFITKLNQLTGKSFRLPTEAEWEFAARGGKLSQGYKYSGRNAVDDVAWFVDNSESTTHPVGAKSPNELGLYDMSGNVFEWCQDWYGNYSGDSQINPAGPASGTYRICRGGGWNYSDNYCRVSYRSYHSMTSKYDRIGLRLALD